MRKPAVTRTIKAAVLTVLVADGEKRELTEETVTLPRTYKKQEPALSALRAYYRAREPNRNVTPIRIVGYKEVTLYCRMSLEDYFNQATITEI